MKILCAISGIEYNCEHFPAVLSSRDTLHPIFDIKQKKLISFISKWAGGELTSTDSFLLFLALLNSTDLVDWRVPVYRTAVTDSLVANNMEGLVRIVSQMNLIKHPELAMPSFVVSQETKTLDNVHYWIETWQDAIEAFKSNYKATATLHNIRQREAILERLIKSADRDISSYSGMLADWAELAGTFPKFEITDYKGARVSIADYWKLIIKKCTKSESIFEIPKNDLLELIEHCEDNIPHGSIYSHTLMTLLRDGLKRQSSFLGLDSSKTDFVILDADTSVEDANKLAIINSAPDVEPIKSNYPTNFAYLKAKLAWEMASRYKEQLATSPIPTDSNTPVDNNDIQTNLGAL